jgi:hypothetical protein
MIETVETDLLNQFAAWETLDNPTDEQFVNVILQWAWDHGCLADRRGLAQRQAVGRARHCLSARRRCEDIGVTETISDCQ